MENQEDYYERIEQYLTGSLPIADRQAFEHNIQQNPTLAREVEFHRQLQQAVQREAQDMLIAQAIQKVASDYFADEPQASKVIRMPHSNTRWYWLAASITFAFLLGIGIYFMNFNPPSNQALFADNFVVYKAPVLFRSGEKTKSATLEDAFVAYNQQAYQQAAGLFSKSLQENPRQIVPYFYIGQCSLALNDPNEAVTSLQKVIAHGDNAYVTQSKWYLALAYLTKNQEEQAIPLLRELSRQGGAFSKQAQELLQELPDQR